MIHHWLRGKDVKCQGLGATVDETDGFVAGCHAEDWQHGSEELLLHDRAVSLRVHHDRRLDISLALLDGPRRRRGPPELHETTVRLAKGFVQSFHCLLVDHAAKFLRCLRAVTEHFRDDLLETCNNLITNSAFHQHVIWRDAGLPTIHELPHCDPSACLVDVDASTDHDRGLSTQLQRQRSKIRGGGCHYQPAHACRPCIYDVIEGLGNQGCGKLHTAQAATHRSLIKASADAVHDLCRLWRQL
mmetsp:Transcript_49894/g.117400  ORF Transcript_49894/g.117400 Transcript_49894/m.117400 type:complete len:244 (-) Transcript_49894:530-1261(-)